MDTTASSPAPPIGVADSTAFAVDPVRPFDIPLEALSAAATALNEAHNAVESADERLAQVVLQAEQARTKFDDFAANVKILVSSSGFTKTALTKAARYGIKTITPGEVPRVRRMS